MRWHLTDYRVAYGAAGSPVVALHAGTHHVADVHFTEAPQARFTEDFETRFVRIELTPTELAPLLDLLRHERVVTLDTEVQRLEFRRA